MAAIRRFMTGVSFSGLMAWRVAAAAFHIEPGDLSLALNDWSRQSGFQLLFDYNVIHGRPSPLVDCECDALEALSALLGESGAIYEPLNERTVAILVIPMQPARDIGIWLRRFPYVAQVYAEGAGPPVAPLVVTWGEAKVIAAQR